MTKTVIFQCDLCSSRISGLKDGNGIIWRGAPERIGFVPLKDSEHHLCQRCIDQLEDLFYRERELNRQADEEAAHRP